MQPVDFAEYFMSLQAPLRAYLHGVAGSFYDADDMFQNVWRIAWEKLDTYDESRPFKPWIFGIARLEALKWRQKHARSREVLSDQAVAALARTAADSAGEIALRHTFLMLCMDELQGTSRRVLEMKYYSRKKIEEIARSLEKSTASVKMVLVRVRRALRDCIERRAARTEGEQYAG
ncbi:sigma-70 family RNA polymerase sigma factor [Verrucomicrobiota bacterium]